jgi:hypothetical protein
VPSARFFSAAGSPDFTAAVFRKFRPPLDNNFSLTQPAESREHASAPGKNRTVSAGFLAGGEWIDASGLDLQEP